MLSNYLKNSSRHLLKGFLAAIEKPRKANFSSLGQFLQPCKEFPVLDQSRYFLFNVFESVPPAVEEQFRQGWDDKAQYVMQSDQFLATYLHYSPGSVQTWVNFAVFKSEDTCALGKPDAQWQQKVGDRQKAPFSFHPAGYRLVASSNGAEYVNESVEDATGKGVFLTLIQAPDRECEDKVIANWKELSGISLLHKKLQELSPDHQVQTLLYRRYKMAPKYSLVARTSLPIKSAVNVARQIADDVTRTASTSDDVTVTTVYYTMDTVYVSTN